MGAEGSRHATHVEKMKGQNECPLQHPRTGQQEVRLRQTNGQHSPGRKDLHLGAEGLERRQGGSHSPVLSLPSVREGDLQADRDGGIA